MFGINDGSPNPLGFKWHFNWSWLFKWTGYMQVKIKIVRLDSDDTGEYGHLTTDNGYDCVTLENTNYLIKPGIYKVIIDHSPHLGYDTPHIIDSERDKEAGGDAGLRIHILNFENQSEGCIGVGLHRVQGAIEHSQAAFQGLMTSLKGATDISLEIV